MHFDCLPVSVSTEPVYSDDQFTNSYSNPYKLYNSEQTQVGSVKYVSKQQRILAAFTLTSADCEPDIYKTLQNILVFSIIINDLIYFEIKTI